MEYLSNVLLGLSTALALHNLMACFIGVFVGTLVGVLPGMGALAAMSMLLPITFHMDPTSALIMLAGIWYGTAYGGSVGSILLNIPGQASSAVTCLDGYPMAMQGRAGVALLGTTIASFIGGSIGILLMMMSAPVIAQYALRFGSAEYFSLMVFGLIASSSISEGSAIKGYAMVVLGIIFGTVGMDMYTGAMRYNFGFLQLAEGVNLVPLSMGIFGVAELIVSVRRVDVRQVDRTSTKFRAMKPTSDDLRRFWAPVLRGSAIGSFLGALPGVGPSVASFLAYAVEKRVGKEPQRFGKGAIEGILSPEAANNAADQTSFIPTLALGIPGSSTMALMLGALMIQGIAPGPRMISDHSALFWGLVMSFWVGNVLLVILNLPLIGIWVRMLLIPYHLLYPAVIAFMCIGAYAVTNSAFDVWMVALFGFIGYLLRVFKFPAAPMLLGFVLGPLLEEHFRRAMIYSHGDALTFFVRPISGTFMLFTLLFLLWVNMNSILGCGRAMKRAVVGARY